MNAISDNIANMNDVTSTSQAAYQPRFVVTAADPRPGRGARAGAREEASIGGGIAGHRHRPGRTRAGVLEYDPNSPLADKHGMVRAADVDLGTANDRHDPGPEGL